MNYKDRIIIIIGGILGLSIARKILIEGFKNIIVLEKEKSVANRPATSSLSISEYIVKYIKN